MLVTVGGSPSSLKNKKHGPGVSYFIYVLCHRHSKPFPASVADYRALGSVSFVNYKTSQQLLEAVDACNDPILHRNTLAYISLEARLQHNRQMSHNN